jgi:hypothetical protein
VTLLPETSARADPSAVEASRFEARVTVDGVWPMPAGTVATDTAPDGAAWGPGDPQTSQYPSTMAPVQPGWAQAVVVVMALLRAGV